jgi:predicted transcriptional regulator
MSGTVKISANLSEAVVEALRETAEKKGVSMTEALRQAISHESYFQDAVSKGQKVLLEEPKTGRLREVIIDAANTSRSKVGS